MTFRARGLFAATVTPMHEDGSLDLDRVSGLVDHLIQIGLEGLFVGGSTGEWTCLTVDERKEALEAYASAASGRLPVIANIGHESLFEARGLAEHACGCGVDAIAATPSTYFRPQTVEVLADCLADIARVAPELPLYYYHIPILTNVDLDMAALLKVADERLPTFVGLKFSHLDLDMVRACTSHGDGKYDVLFGFDEYLLDGLEAGCLGAIGSTYNFLAPAYRRVMDSRAAGDLDEARRQQERVRELVNVLVEYRRPPASIKAALQLVGQPCGPCRLPNETMKADEIDSMRDRLDAMGFFDLVRP